MPQLFKYALITSCVICQNKAFVQLTEAPDVNYFQCQPCRVIFLNPQPRFEALKDQYTRPGLWQEGPASTWFHHNKYYRKNLYQERLDDILA